MENYVKPTLAFVDHSFHKKTHSGDFLRELFSNHFHITDYWDDSWNGGQRVKVADINKYEYVFYFQLINPLWDIKKVKSKIIWAPMYDGMRFDDLYWKILASLPIKVICFSKIIYDQCNLYGIDAISVQYYFEPSKERTSTERPGKHFFFWYRGHITFDDIKKVLHPKDVDSFTYKSTPDPFKKKEQISDADIQNYKIKMIESGFLPKNEYLDLLSTCNVFIAPRKKEGIGMSFLEAMSIGLVLVGNDQATLNEYISDHFNGYLFSGNSTYLDFGDFDQVRINSVNTATDGYEIWVNSKSRILSFMFSSYPKIKKWTLQNYIDFASYSLREIKRTTMKMISP